MWHEPGDGAFDVSGAPRGPAAADVEDPAAVGGMRPAWPWRWSASPWSRRRTGPSVAPGVPGTVVVGAGGVAVSTALDAARAGQRGFKGKVGQSMTVVGEPSAQGSLGEKRRPRCSSAGHPGDLR